VVTGLTGDRHRFDWCRPREAVAAGWPDTNGRVTRGWPNFSRKWWFGIKGYERLNTFQLINHLCVVTKFGMSLAKFLIEQSALFEKFEISLALYKGELITTLESLMGLTISSKWSCSLILSCISKRALDKHIFQKEQVRASTDRNLNIYTNEMVLRQRYVFMNHIEIL
jgi:hypothetical protein